MEIPTEVSEKTLFEQVRDRAVNEGISTCDEYIDLVDEIVMEKLNDGYFSQDEDLVQVRRDLEQRWPEVEEELKKNVRL